ncbi:MAG: M20/M25/M40 family metallo-hydrolase [Bacteroidia bacterium]|nr:M20/M25/M40 family metallo-hydrolase [Bacteroidia bacterium]
MKKSFLTLFSIILIYLSASAQKEGLASINKDNLESHMEFFASDELKGREAGTDANEIAALYIKTNIMRMGLKPDAGGYFQGFPLTMVKSSVKESYLKVSDNSGNQLFSTDSILQIIPPKGTLEAEGNLVFAGFGYEDSTSAYSDLAGIDVKDKIVLVMTRTPEAAKNNITGDMLGFQLEMEKIGRMMQKGAKAFIFVFDPGNTIKDPYNSIFYDFSRSGQVVSRNGDFQGFPFIFDFVRLSLADRLLASTGKTVKQYYDQIVSTGKPASADVPGIKVSLRSDLEKREFEIKNVIGIVEGSDPVLKKECIVYTAHFDHVGKNAKGEVFNGADDNASGTVGLLELAGAFTSLKKKPLRSVVFVWANGEEKGLLGSGHYVNNPSVPLEKTLLNINLDMIGRTWTPADTGKFYGMDMDVTKPGEVILYTKHESSDLMKLITSAADKSSLKVIDKGEDIEAGGSDHESFWDKGVPAVMFHTGIHSDVHQVTDDEAKIDYDKMEQITKMVFSLGYAVANQRVPFKVENREEE